MIRAWLQASRPLSQANIAVPLVFGQALAYAVHGRFDLVSGLAVHAFGIVDQLFIVYANDWADHEADRENTAPTPFSGGSRVLVEGKLSRRALGIAALVMGALVLAFGLVAALTFDRLPALPLAAAAIALLLAYSFPPLRLSYRGHGEILQGLGIGVVLPLFAFALQSGDLAGFPWSALAVTFLLGYAGNVTTALPDTPADRSADKRTLPVRIGELRARVASLALFAAASLLVLVVAPPLSAPARLVVAAIPLALLLPNLALLRRADAGRDACLFFVLLNGTAATVLFVAWSVALVVEALA